MPSCEDEDATCEVPHDGYFGLPIWICMSFLNIRFVSHISFYPIMCSINLPMNKRIPTSTINVSCFLFHKRFRLLWLAELDLYVFVDPTIYIKSYVCA